MNGGQVTLAYNGLGQLVSKTGNGVTTQYLIDDLSLTGYPQYGVGVGQWPVTGVILTLSEAEGEESGQLYSHKISAHASSQSKRLIIRW